MNMIYSTTRVHHVFRTNIIAKSNPTQLGPVSVHHHHIANVKRLFAPHPATQHAVKQILPTLIPSRALV
ncbi:hypothetical protein BCR34DRAFT_6300 [Clohesyomyces aquaticus]|uniref:Uncharacterized protein n=1 Tax=Clohesyomyces aquaticus TaxID=1231657 RepID=A0A1Y2AC87_9PLEO|nr:hypothetical protein BCR34DRAFT_6300 [Clohesyomyces aquaticus]